MGPAFAGPVTRVCVCRRAELRYDTWTVPSQKDRTLDVETRVLAWPTIVSFWSILALTAAVCLVWSHYRLFWGDELLEYNTDTKSSVAKIISGQLHAPFSLEPPGFHLLLHLTHKLLPWPKLASRLPSIVALLVTEACTFLLTLRLSRRQVTSLVAMLVPFYLVTVDYGVEARVYGALTAAMAVALLCWAYLVTGGRRRPLALTGLAAALVGAVLMHYYAVFLLVPFFIGESVRTWEQRRADWPVVGALFAGAAAVLADVPFERALAPFRQHYYSTETDWANIPFTYGWYYRHFRLYTEIPAYVFKISTMCLCLVLVLVGAALWRAGRQWRTTAAAAPVQIALAITALLPVLNLVAAQFTKAYVPRYSLPGVVGVAVLAALLAEEFLVLTRVQVALACILLFGSLNYARNLIYEMRVARAVGLSRLELTPAQQQVLASLPDHHIYFQNVAAFLFYHYYVPKDLNGALSGVFSVSCELKWAGRNPGSLFARNMGATTEVPFVPYASLREHPAPRLLVVYHDPHEEWIEDELKAEKVKLVPLGRAFGGDLVELTVPAQSTCDTDRPPG